MSIDLPPPIAGYFAADQSGNTESLASLFAAHAVVRDEGQTHAGLDAIKAWKASTSKEYSYTAEPFSLSADGERAVVTSHLTGNFPGRPLDLRYFFRLEGNKITELEIRL